MLFSPFQWFKKGTSTMVLITSTATWRPCLNPEDQSLPDRKDASSRPPPTPSFSLVCLALAGHVTMQRKYSMLQSSRFLGPAPRPAPASFWASLAQLVAL